MKFIYGKNDFKDFATGNKYCYLLTNGLGGYSSTTIINSLTRGDHSLFTAAIKAPNVRKNIISKVCETLIIDNKKIELSAQEFVCKTKNIDGFKHLHSFKQEYLPEWHYFFDGVLIKKTLVFEFEKNTLGIKYVIENNSNFDVKLLVTPLLQFSDRGKSHESKIDIKEIDNTISFNNIDLQSYSNYDEKLISDINFENDYYYEYDSIDGRNAFGSATSFISYAYKVSKHNISDVELIFTLENDTPFGIDTLIENEIERQKNIINTSNQTDELAKALVRASDQFISKRESTNAKTILAGYPWFEDWGRDTMFAILGSCISTRRFDDAKDIFRTFIKYTDKGLMPNLFPEGDKAPLYNTVDASLLYIYAIYEYYMESNDLEFIKNEAFDTIIDIINWYVQGTDFDIYMDTDSLIHAGSGYDQVTWMDVRFDTILPTPRHGKPVEINALWYNALKVASFFGEKFKVNTSSYEALSRHVKLSFNDKFWNVEKNCLKDVVSGNSYDNQVRSNQIWAVMMPFSPLNNEKSKLVVDKVYNELYTPYGLRSLSPYDAEFVSEYGGSHFKRDMSYHQGTVWTFPLGGYFIAYLKVNNYSALAKQKVREQLEYFEACLREGCVGQIAEIYDGLNPIQSRGCFAQAWSTSEILRVFTELSKEPK